MTLGLIPMGCTIRETFEAGLRKAGYEGKPDPLFERIHDWLLRREARRWQKRAESAEALLRELVEALDTAPYGPMSAMIVLKSPRFEAAVEQARQHLADKGKINS